MDPGFLSLFSRSFCTNMVVTMIAPVIHTSTPSLFPFPVRRTFAWVGLGSAKPLVCNCCCFSSSPVLLHFTSSHTPLSFPHPLSFTLPPLSPALSPSLSPLSGEIFTSPSLCLSAARSMAVSSSYSSPYFCL